MSLRASIEQSGNYSTDYDDDNASPVVGGSRNVVLLKRQLHTRLVESMDLNALESMSTEELKNYLSSAVRKVVLEDRLVINDTDLSRLIKEIQDEVMGLGPLEPLLLDPSVSDILVNNYNTIFVERKGRLERTLISFESDAHLLKIIEKIVGSIGRRIDESSPMVDARLPDGSRVNAIIPPLALDGPALSIRRFSAVPLTMGNLLEYGALTEEMAVIIGALVKAKTNILISGGTGSGKTTLLNILSSYIPENERIITIEDAAELRLMQPHVVRLETRPPNMEGAGEIDARALVKNTLRMRPDRIIIGECRGGEIIDMLQAMNTGHEGSLTTIHANTARDALVRLENMVGLAGYNVQQKALRQQVVAAISVVIQTSRLSDGRRKIISIQELTGMEGDMITMQEIFKFEQTAVAPDGTVLGRFRATGIRPKFADKLQSRGVPLADYLFDPDKVQDR